MNRMSFELEQLIEQFASSQRHGIQCGNQSSVVAGIPCELQCESAELEPLQCKSVEPVFEQELELGKAEQLAQCKEPLLGKTAECSQCKEQKLGTALVVKTEQEPELCTAEQRSQCKEQKLCKLAALGKEPLLCTAAEQCKEQKPGTTEKFAQCKEL